LLLDARAFNVLTLSSKIFLPLKVELSFDKNGIQSAERLFAMCSKLRSGAKSVRSKMIVRHLSNGCYKIPALRTRLYCTMRFDENFNVFLRSILDTQTASQVLVFDNTNLLRRPPVLHTNIHRVDS